MSQNLVVELNQAAIDGIRDAGATTQWINVEGNAWTGAHAWVSSGNGATMLKLKDKSDKIMYQMHQYLDKNFAGGQKDTPHCVSRTFGREKLAAATKWLRDNKKLGILGEFAGDSTPMCKEAIRDMLDYLVKNKDVWRGALWWAAGPWWPSDTYGDLEPNKGLAWKADYVPLLMQYA